MRQGDKGRTDGVTWIEVGPATDESGAGVAAVAAAGFELVTPVTVAVPVTGRAGRL
jgi:hypothetical protein